VSAGSYLTEADNPDSLLLQLKIYFFFLFFFNQVLCVIQRKQSDHIRMKIAMKHKAWQMKQTSLSFTNILKQHDYPSNVFHDFCDLSYFSVFLFSLYIFSSILSLLLKQKPLKPPPKKKKNPRHRTKTIFVRRAAV